MKSLLITLVAISAISVIPPEPFPRPLFGDGEIAVYKTGIAGAKSKPTGWGGETSARYRSTEYTQKVQLTGDAITVTRIDKLVGGGKHETQFILKGSQKVRVTNWTDTFYAPAGKPESRLDCDFSDPSLKYPPDMIPVMCLSFLLRGVDFKNLEAHETRLWFAPMSFSSGEWIITGKKTITAPAGKFECYEIQARIIIDEKGIIADTLNKFLPKYYYYLNVNPPHNLVRFQAQIPGHEMFYDELVSFTPGK